jgi:hypothetical protein
MLGFVSGAHFPLSNIHLQGAHTTRIEKQRGALPQPGLAWSMNNHTRMHTADSSRRVGGPDLALVAAGGAARLNRLQGQNVITHKCTQQAVRGGQAGRASAW